MTRLAAIIDTDTDAVHVFLQCETCWRHATTLGQAGIDDEPYYWAVL